MEYFNINQPIQIIAEKEDYHPSELHIQFQTAPEKSTPDLPGKNLGDVFLKQSPLRADLLVSVGKPEKLITESFRILGGTITRWLQQHNVDHAVIHVDPLSIYNVENAVPALFEGIFLGSYQFDKYKKVEEARELITIYVIGKELEYLVQLVNRTGKLTYAVNLSREWAHEPANIINPVTLAERAVQLAQKYNLSIKVLTDQELDSMGAGAITAVGKGSATPSRLIVVEYPGKDSQARPVILVGKAITFDTGGYSLKSVENIVNMKYDKSGGITVLATIQAAAELKLDQRIIGIVAAAENMICDHSYRPDDIIKSLSGKTIEIISTDAEGRLVLADALTYAQQTYHPKALIDLATLTGGVLVALGRVRAGLLSNNDELAQKLFEAGEKTHERLWRLPLDDDFKRLIKSDDADIKNSGGREGHCILGGIFLQNFVEDSIPWAHLDIAGMADTNKETTYCPKGGTGFGVRLLINYLENL